MIKKILLAIAVLVLAGAVGYCQEQPLQLTIESDKEVYAVGKKIIVDFIITNQSKEDIQIYFINTFESGNYLSIETLDGDKIFGQRFGIYKWENPTFHLIEGCA